jgi:hypothetical protein
MPHIKECYYFPHDSNARNDEKITWMRTVYGSEGYGWYWILIEMLRDQNDYKLNYGNKYACNALALQLQCNADAAHKFIEDCINEFNLFESDGEFFWSNSLIRRMKNKDEKSEKARQAALSRWDKKCNADAMQTQCDSNASKVNKSKVNKKDILPKPEKIKFADDVTMTEEEHRKLVEKLGEQKTADMIERLSLYKGSTGTKYKSDYKTILSWINKDKEKQRAEQVKPKYTSSVPPGFRVV